MSSKNQSSNTLYYDKLREHDEDLSQGWFKCCRKKENKVDKLEPEKKNHDFAVSYKDMENLLNEFHACQGILKNQLKDTDRKKKGEEDEDKEMEPLAQLITELNDMVRFVNENNEVVN